MSFRVRVRVRGLVLGPLGPWAIWVPGSLGPPGPIPGPKEHEFPGPKKYEFLVSAA